MNVSKWILTVPREIHLGFIKESFGRGSVIELDENRGIIVIDGRKFDDTRDLELLQRQSIKNPQSPWVMPFSEELLAAIKGTPAPVKDITHRSRPGDGMPIVQDDSSDHPVIDIRNTQMSKVHQAQKEAERTAAHNREVGREMEIVRGDETADERRTRILAAGGDDAPIKIQGEATESRIRKLEAYMADRRNHSKPTDLSVQAELVVLKRQRTSMPIVHDDSLGMGVGKNEIPMNAGQHLPNREEADAKTADRQAEAEIRKKHVEMARRRVGIEIQDDVLLSGIDQDIPPELAEASEVLGGTEVVDVLRETDKAVTDTKVSDADVEALEADMEREAASQSQLDSELEAENAELRAQNEYIMSRLAALESSQRRGRGRPKGSRDKAPRKKTTEPVSKVK